MSFFPWILLFLPQLAFSHLASDSFISLHLQDSKLIGQWDLPIANLRAVTSLGKKEITTSQDVTLNREEIIAYSLTHFFVVSDQGVCKVAVPDLSLDTRSAGAYATLSLNVACPASATKFTFDYTPFFDRDPQHKGYLNLNAEGTIQAAIFSKGATSNTVEPKAPSPLRQFFNFLIEGVWHIWLGYDHILFLLTLLLPSVLIRQEKGWKIPNNFRSVFKEVLKVVTAFTIAHSVTLALAALQIVQLPSRFVESTIAASVVLSALNNIFPMVKERRWLIAFVFGFIHGFGFASVLGDLGLPRASLAAALFGFNLGVEVGQLAIVATVLPLFFWLRRTQFYLRFLLVGGSGATAITALLWMIERVGQLKFMPF